MTIHKSGPVAAFVLCFVLSGAGLRAAVQISGKPTQNMNCAAGMCTPTAKAAVLNAGDLAGLLASGDVMVISSNAAPDIEVTAGVSWTSAHRLTLDAYRSILFRKPVTAAGPGALTLTTGDGSTDGDFSFSGNGHVEFWETNSSLVINGNSYTLASTLTDLAAAISNNLNGYYALANSYNAAPDGTYTTAALGSFSGTFEGLGNAVSNYSLRLEANGIEGGLFGCACPGSIVRDLAMKNANVRGADSADVVGALAGLSYGIVQGVPSAAGYGEAENQT